MVFTEKERPCLLPTKVCALMERLFKSQFCSFCLTITIDSISHPFQIREKNMYKTADKTIYKQVFNPENLIRCWNECLDKSSFQSRRMQVEEFNKKNYWKKRGIAIIPMKFSVGFAATSYHQVRPLYTGNAPHVMHTSSTISLC